MALPPVLARAQTAVGNNPKKWEFQNDAFTNVQTAFGTASTGPWVANPNPATNYYFVQVQTTVSLPMYLIGALGSTSSTIAAGAVAGRTATTGVPGGEFPFSPYTRAASPDNASDPFGYQVGNDYTLRWGAPGNNTTCGTDATQPNLLDQRQNSRILLRFRERREPPPSHRGRRCRTRRRSASP